jgi:hypothetical protein
MKKRLKKLGIQGSHLDVIKATCPYGEKLKTFSLISRMRYKYPAS